MSASNTAAIIAQEIASAATLRAGNSCSMAVTALLAYDVILTSGQEYQYIWKSSKSWASRVLYAWNRYVTLLSNLLELGTLPSMSDTSCVALTYLVDTAMCLNLLGPAMFTTLRIYALSKKNRTLGGVALVLSLAPFVINMNVIYRYLPVNLPAPDNCEVASTISPSLHTGADVVDGVDLVTIASRGCLILADSLVVAVTWYTARSASLFRTSTISRRSSLERVMWENGSFYFYALVSMNIVEMILVIVSVTVVQPGEGAYLIYFIDPISSTLNSRFLLDLHETNARLEGADVSLSSLSLDINSGVERRRGSAELPAFLATVGGPIHSFHDHEDEDWGSVEFAMPSQGGESEAGVDMEASAEAETQRGVESGTVVEGGIVEVPA